MNDLDDNLTGLADTESHLMIVFYQDDCIAGEYNKGRCGWEYAQFKNLIYEYSNDYYNTQYLYAPISAKQAKRAWNAYCSNALLDRDVVVQGAYRINVRD